MDESATPGPGPIRFTIKAEALAGDRELGALARRLYEERRARDALFGRGLFGEPAWDILLDLFISEHEGRIASLEAVSAAASIPMGAAYQFIEHLVAEGFICRVPGRDKIRAWLELTDEGRARMQAALGRILGKGTV